MDKPKTLLLCPAACAFHIDGEIWFDRKFFDGLISYIDGWPGFIRLAIRVLADQEPQFGSVRYDASDCSFQLIALQQNELVSSIHLNGVSVVLASADEFRNLHLAKLCKSIGITCVYDIENTLWTRIQIASFETKGHVPSLKRYLWLVYMEVVRRMAFRAANGIQANGVPAFDAYRSINPNTILYFDTRTTNSLLVSKADLRTRLDYLVKGKPLRLCFSGRLLKIKGADQLCRLALRLKELGVECNLDIFGDGNCAHVLRSEIAMFNLQETVHMHGAVDFSNVLMPYMSKNVDVFVCCHPQGDPSCTYLETYACGVPIAGYANRAHSGILNMAPTGWAVDIGDINKLAQLIASLDHNRTEIRIKSENARTFASQHLFDQTFRYRIQHCLAIEAARSHSTNAKWPTKRSQFSK